MRVRFTETIGQYLRREREARSVSLEELSRGTRISRPFLDALERDDFHFFSQREFILGFLRGYARHLGLDQEEVLRRYRFQAELESRKENFRQLSLFTSSPSYAEETQEPERAPQKLTPPKEKKHSRLSIYIQTAILIAALGLSFFIYAILKQMENSPKSLEGERNPSQEGKENKPNKTNSLLPAEQDRLMEIGKGTEKNSR
ncbi:MAG: hypothetical protein FJ117_10760 [Deltaproteobacteria bacterium]|nr:hypothetical protein [Deltaproteobacteria bacterium]